MYLKANKQYKNPNLLFWKMSLCPYQNLISEIFEKIKLSNDSNVLDASCGLGIMS